MKTVTIDQFIEFDPCWNEDDIMAVARDKTVWTALDVLNLDDEIVSPKEKLWIILREEFIEAEILHEFACRCADLELSKLKNPDPRSLDAVKSMRRWLRGEIDDDAIDAARSAAQDALLEDRSTARFSARATWAPDRAAIWWDAGVSARQSSRNINRKWQCEELRRMLDDQNQ